MKRLQKWETGVNPAGTSGSGVTGLEIGHPRLEEEEVFFHQVPAMVD